MFRRLLPIYLLLLPAAPVAAQQGLRALRFTSSHTSFPDTGRSRGHLYDSVLYTAAEHYSDSSVLLFVPERLMPGKAIDLIFWFHGWRNNIDTAAVFYELTRQFAASGRNAVLVLAETAKNVPDSYGGRLEQPGVFKALVADVLQALKKNGVVPRTATPGQITLAGHSGAFRVIAYILQNGQQPVREVLLFDALYSQVDKYMRWIKEDDTHRFVHWFTNHGGGTDIMSDTMMRQLTDQHINYTLAEETGLQPAVVQDNRVLFVHSLREHNVIINRPDDFLLLLQNSPLPVHFIRR